MSDNVVPLFKVRPVDVPLDEQIRLIRNDIDALAYVVEQHFSATHLPEWLATRLSTMRAVLNTLLRVKGAMDDGK